MGRHRFRIDIEFDVDAAAAAMDFETEDDRRAFIEEQDALLGSDEAVNGKLLGAAEPGVTIHAVARRAPSPPG